MSKPLRSYDKKSFSAMSREEVSWIAVASSPDSTHDNHSSSRKRRIRHGTPTENSRSSWLYFPISTFGAILGSVVCWALMGWVLYKSHGDIAENWSPQPAVYLSVLSVLSAACLRHAYTQGSAIQWWVELNELDINIQESEAETVDESKESRHKDQQIQRQLKDNLKTANDLWKSTHSVSFVLKSIWFNKTLGVLSWACIILTLLPASSPLLQRASYIDNMNYTVPVVLGISTRTSLPTNFTGLMHGNSDKATGLTPDFTNVVTDFTIGAYFPMDYNNCTDAVCQSGVQGIGLAHNCSNTSVTVGFAPGNDPSPVFSLSFSAPDKNDTAGNLVELSIIRKGKATAGSTQDSCLFPIISTTCKFSSAVVNYSVATAGDYVNLDPSITLGDDQILSHNADDQPSSWSGLLLLLQSLYTSSATLVYSDKTYSINSTGLAAFTYVDDSSLLPCDQTWADPTPDLLQQIRQIMFATALYARSDNDDRETRQVNSTAIYQFAVFQSDYKFLGLSMAISALSLLTVIFMAHRWKSLNRKVDLSPGAFTELFNPKLRPSEAERAERSRLRKGFRELLDDWWNDN